MTTTLLVGLLAASTVMLGAEHAVKMKDLPPAVQKAVHEQTQGATVKGVSKEVEGGKTLYEVETVANGKTRDLILDSAGVLVEVEQEVDLASIPGPAKTAIETYAKGGKINKVETLTKGDVVLYEAAVRKGVKNSEVTVSADGTVQKK